MSNKTCIVFIGSILYALFDICFYSHWIIIIESKTLLGIKKKPLPKFLYTSVHILYDKKLKRRKTRDVYLYCIVGFECSYIVVG